MKRKYSTGRISGPPVLQPMPLRTQEAKDLRAAFAPKADYVLIDCDYSSFEMRHAAELLKSVKK